MSNKYNVLCVHVAKLRSRDRRLLRLYHEHGITILDMADVFDMPEPAVRRALRRAEREYDRCYCSIKW
jgi:DNA-directed RNA polymerase specialized sigma24 family protein